MSAGEMKWQPIETAPKTGLRVLVWDTLNNEMSIAFYNHDDCDAYTGWFHVNDWVGGCRFEHWMQLPAPPASVLEASNA